MWKAEIHISCLQSPSILFFKIFKNYMYICVSVEYYVHMSVLPVEARRGPPISWVPRGRVSGHYELPYMDAGNCTLSEQCLLLITELFLQHPLWGEQDFSVNTKLTDLGWLASKFQGSTFLNLPNRDVCHTVAVFSTWFLGLCTQVLMLAHQQFTDKAVSLTPTLSLLTRIYDDSELSTASTTLKIFFYTCSYPNGC